MAQTLGRTVKRTYVEEIVVDALRTRLMTPEVYAAFVVQVHGRSATLYAALWEAKGPKAALAVAEAPAPLLMPDLAELYRQKVAALREALAARERVRALTDEVRLIPCPGDPKAGTTIEVRGLLPWLYFVSVFRAHASARRFDLAGCCDGVW